MSRSLRRGSLAAIAAIAIASLSACSAGNTAETLEVKPDSASVSVGDSLKLNNIVIVTGDESSGEHTGPANLTVNISNGGTTPATLQAVTVGSASATLTDAAGAPVKELVIPAGDAVLLGGKGQPSAHLASVTLKVGGFVPSTFTFAGAGKVDAQAAVYPNAGIYKGYGPTAAPTATASPSAPAGSPSAPATPSGAASPSAPAASPSAPATPAAPSGAASPSASGSPVAAGH